MSNPSPLLEFARDIRNYTIKLLEISNDEEVLFAPAGTANHMLWHAGHAVAVAHRLALAALTGERPLPDGFFETFGWNSRPAETTRWPARTEILAALKAQSEELFAAIQSATPEKLAQPYGDPARNRTVQWYVIHALHDEAKHQGEMYLIKKLYARSQA